MELGYDLRGVMYWTLVDNFEWGFGYSMRVGAVSGHRGCCPAWPGGCWWWLGSVFMLLQPNPVLVVHDACTSADARLTLAVPRAVWRVPLGERRQPEAGGAQERRASQELVRRGGLHMWCQYRAA